VPLRLRGKTPLRNLIFFFSLRFKKIREFVAIYVTKRSYGTNKNLSFWAKDELFLWNKNPFVKIILAFVTLCAFASSWQNTSAKPHISPFSAV